MAESMAVCDLARELGVSSVKLLEYATKNGIKVRRVAAILTAAQEKRLRDIHEAELKRLRAERDRWVGLARTAPPPVRAEPRYGRCTCCEQPFQFHPGGDHDDVCKRCLAHVPVDGEPVSRHLDRESTQATIYKSMLQTAGESAAEAKHRMHSAYASRDKWRRLLVETAVAHEQRPDGQCVCGAGKYPCVTRRSVEYRNIGIAKQIEELEGLSDEEFEQFLYGDDRHLKPMDNDEDADTA